MPFPRITRTLELVMTPLSSVTKHRYLLREFVLRDVKGRFAGSVGGVLWTLINPLATVVIYLFVFSLIMRVQVTVEDTGTSSFALFFLTGLFSWLWFSEGLSKSVGSLVDNANLITKVVFPVELLPTGTVLAAFIVNGVGMSFLLAYLFSQGYGHISWLLLPLLVATQVVFTWGMALFVAAACVFIRDTRELLGIILMIWFFATPIIYPLSMVPESCRLAIRLNPMAVFASLYRDALLRHQVSLVPLIGVISLSVGSYLLGAWFFMRAKPSFGDVL
jgi:lipopolysaccharide transport system permease protein